MAGRHLTGILIGALAIADGAFGQANDPGLYLFKIPAVRAPGVDLPLGAHVQADFHVPNAANLLERLADTSLAVLAVEEGLVRVSIGSGETLGGEPLPAHRTATFVVDFAEPPVAKLSNKLGESYGAEPSIDELVRFVDMAIREKSYRRQFDLASQVAISGEGDCTEHAVLLAAMARATGRAARVVLGVMLVETAEELMALGHAWTEIHDGHAWRVADATRPEVQLPQARPRYVPLLGLEDEGPGYALQVANVTAVYPVRVDGIRTLDGY